MNYKEEVAQLERAVKELTGKSVEDARDKNNCIGSFQIQPEYLRRILESASMGPNRCYTVTTIFPKWPLASM